MKRPLDASHCVSSLTQKQTRLEGDPEEAQVKICILGISGNIVATCECLRSLTIGELKRHLQDLHKIPALRQRVLLQSDILDDEIVLENIIQQDLYAMTLGLVLMAYDTQLAPKLLSTVHCGEGSVVNEVLRTLADPNANEKCGRTALFSASRHGHIEIVRTLCGSLADISRAESRRHRTPLYMAAQAGHIDVTQHLCDALADVNCFDVVGASPLIAAADCPSKDVVRVLCAARAELDTKESTKSESAIFVASRKGCPETVRALCEARANIESTQLSDVTPLHIAAAMGHRLVVQVLCEARASVDRAESERCTTPLLSAAEQGHVRVVRSLCAFGADKDLSSRDGVTPLMVATQNGNVQVARALCNARAFLDKMGSQDATALHIAAAIGHVDLARLLSSSKADSNKKNRCLGATPLFIAADRGHSRVVDALCAIGANQDIATHRGKTPFYAARKKGHVAVIAALEKAEPNREVAKARRADARARLMRPLLTGQLGRYSDLHLNRSPR